MKKLYSDKSGFTLIEMLLVIAIIAIVCTIGFGALLRNNRTFKELQVAQRQVTAMMREAQNYALTGRVADNSGEIACGYGFTFLNDVKSFVIFYNPKGGSATCDTVSKIYTGGTSVIVAQEKLSDSKQFVNPGSHSVYFSIPFATVYDACGNEASAGGCAAWGGASKKFEYTVQDVASPTKQIKTCISGSGKIQEEQAIGSGC